MEREAAEARALEEPANAQAAERASTALDTDAERAVENAATEQAAAEQAAAEQRVRDEAESSREAERRKQASEAEARDRRDGLNRLNQLLGRADALIQKPDLSLKAASARCETCAAALADVPQLPSKQDYDEIVQRLKAAQTALMPKVQELRDVADWQRWANVGIQEQLCEKMEALEGGRGSRSDRASRSASCSSSGGRPPTCRARRAKRCGGGSRRRTTKRGRGARRISPRRPSARGENLAKKIALCERAEALADSTNWIQTADEIKKLQAEWKTIGPVTRGQEKADLGAVPRRLRSLLHPPPRRSRRAQDGLGREPREEGSAVRRRSKRSPTRPTGTRAAAEIKRLQAEWKTIGPVKKSRSEAIWQRFRGACDHFFARYAQRHDIARAERVAAREAICAELEALAPVAAVTESSRRRRPSAAESRPRPPSGLCSRRFARCAAAGSRSSPRAASTAIARWRSTSASPTRSRASSRAGRRCLPAPISIPTPTASDGNAGRSGWRMLAKSLGGPAAPARCRAVADDAAGGDAEGSARRQHDRRQGRRRQPAAAPRSEDVRQAQASWSRIGPVPDEARRALADRFQRAIRRIAEHRRQRRIAEGRQRRPVDGGDCRPYACLTAACLLILISSTSNTSMPVRRALALVGERSRESRSASSRLRPSAARLRSSPGSRRRAGTSPAAPRDDRAVEHLAVGRPARVVHGDLAARASDAARRCPACSTL